MRRGRCLELLMDDIFELVVTGGNDLFDVCRQVGAAFTDVTGSD